MSEGDLVASSEGASAATLSTSESKAARLARKAESARAARLRHKGNVQNLKERVNQLKVECSDLESLRNAWSSQLRQDLRDALPADRWQTVESWLREADTRRAQEAAEVATAAAAAPKATVPDCAGCAALVSSGAVSPCHLRPVAAVWPQSLSVQGELLSDEAAMEQPELLLCALSMSSPIMRPATSRAPRRSSSLGVLSARPSQVAAARLSAHALGVRERRAVATASARSSEPRALQTSGGARGFKTLDLLEAAADVVSPSAGAAGGGMVAGGAGMSAGGAMAPPTPSSAVAQSSSSPVSITDDLTNAALGMRGLAHSTVTEFAPKLPRDFALHDELRDANDMPPAIRRAQTMP